MMLTEAQPKRNRSVTVAQTSMSVANSVANRWLGLILISQMQAQLRSHLIIKPVNAGVKVYHLAEQKCTTKYLYSQDRHGCQDTIFSNLGLFSCSFSLDEAGCRNFFI
jgi:hypothetical protein